MRPGWRRRPAAPPVATAEGADVVALVGWIWTTEVSITVGLWVGAAQVVELLWYQVGAAETVVFVLAHVRPGQLVAVGLHSVMVTVCVMVEVEVVVISSSAIAIDRLAATTAKMVLNCILNDVFLISIAGMIWVRIVSRS